MSGTVIEGGGDTSDQGGVVAVEAVQSASTHVGVPSVSFTDSYNGAIIEYLAGIPFIADAAYYAAINASATAAANIVWQD